MQSAILLATAIAAAVTFSVHTFVGNPRVAAPLLADRNLPVASKWLNYYCWHAATVLLLFLPVAYGWLAFDPHMPSLVFLTVLCAALSALSAAVERKARLKPLAFPSTSLFACLTLLGALAIWAG